MTNRELCEKYGCCVFAKGIDPDAEASPELEEFLLLAKEIWLDAEASPELEEFLKEFQEESEAFDKLEKERQQNENDSKKRN